jgi:hypothetical protein
MPYPSLQRALDEFLAKLVSEYGEPVLMRLIASNERTEAAAKDAFVDLRVNPPAQVPEVVDDGH